MFKNVLALILVLICGLGIYSLVQAEPVTITAQVERTEEDLLFTENVIGVTKRSEKTYEAAANVTVIPGKFLERYAIRNINDLFEILEGGYHTHKGMDEVLVLRGVVGYANDKILFLYDGMLFPTFLGLGENNWPAGSMDEVERIEIIKGPNTSIWGGQGTQGTINIVHKGASQFQGLKTSVVAGKYGMARYGINYTQKPSDDFSCQLLVNSVYYKAFYRNVKEWWGTNVVNLDEHDIVNPIPDYEVFANANYKDFTIAYRRLESRTGRQDKDHNNTKYIENYADDVNIILRKPEYWSNTDWTTTIRFNNFYQMYDVFHIGNNEGAAGYEMKTEKRYEVDSNVLINPTDALSVVLGMQVGVWSPQGSGPTVNWDPNTRNSDIPGAGNIIDPPEFLPTFTEMGNDIAATELYVDAKYKFDKQLTLTGGGRYVGEFNPGDQFRDAREKMHQFFPKAAAVYNPMENLYLKGIYQQGFTRLNTFERYSEWNNLALRGTQKATTAESTEFVVDWKPIKNMKVLASYYQEILYDFVNFVYFNHTTGVRGDPGFYEWPEIRAALGDIRGFFNVGDHHAHGIEANISYDWDKFGGFISGSQLLKNKIANIRPGLNGGSGVIDTEVDGDFNKSAVPRWNMSLGGYCDITPDYSVSGIYKIHAKLQNRGSIDPNEPGWSGYSWVTGGELDMSATARNVGIPNLNLTVLGKNINNAIYYSGSSMDVGHAIQINPQYFEVKASYLW